jgi:hypothetical protein
MGEFSFFQFELPDASATDGKYYVVKVSVVDAQGRPREKISQKEWARTRFYDWAEGKEVQLVREIDRSDFLSLNATVVADLGNDQYLYKLQAAGS